MSYTETNANSVLDEDFQAGKVFSKSVSIFSRNIVSFTVISSVAALPYIAHPLARSYAILPDDTRLYFAILLPVTLFLLALTTAIILHVTFQQMRGKPVRLTEAISRVCSRFAPLLGVILLYSIGVLLGLALLVVPGIILMVMWYVAVPVCVVENAGPEQSLRRSAALTKGLRWKVFGIFLVFYVGATAGDQVLDWTGPSSVSMMAALVVWQGLTGAFGSVLTTVTYYYLRVAKEGVDIDQIAAVFD
jgi:hypothetical protein